MNVMNQSHWNNNDENQNDRTDVVFSAMNTPDINGSPSQKRGIGRAWTILAVTLLCAVLCFGAGVGGSMLANAWLNDAPTPRPSGNSAPGFDTDTDLQGSQMGVSYDENKRNPLPQMNKADALERVTYTGSAGDEAYETLAQAYANVADTVVEISTETVVNGGWLGNYVTGGAGSGVIISEDGYIVTNHHVISGADSVTVRLRNGNVYGALVVGADEASDIAVLWVDTAGQKLQAATLGCSADLIVGEKVFAIGNPLGSLGGTLTDGIISATARRITIGGSEMTLLQTNTAINPGNSGGGLFNMAGELIGVVNAKCSQDDVEGLGFAIPIDTAYDVICQLIQYGFVRGVVDSGLTLYEADSAMTAFYNFKLTRLGAYIVESKYNEQLQYGDYLLSINGQTVTSAVEAKRLFDACAIGDTVTLEVVRAQVKTQGGRQQVVETTLTIELTLREYVPDGVSFEME
jgi:serine protease Do